MAEIDESEAGGRRVALLGGMDPARRRAMALALAGGGHSVILWLPGEARPEELELQLEIHDAGGISLAHGGEDLGAPAEAFGRIDVAIAEGLEAGRRCLEASGALERRLRPARVVIALGPGEGSGGGNGEAAESRPAREALGVEPPPGVRVMVMAVAAEGDAGAGEWAEAVLRASGLKAIG